MRAGRPWNATPSAASASQRAGPRSRGTARAPPGRCARCPRDRRRAPPSGTGPCPRRTAAGCRRARSPGSRRRSSKPAASGLAADVVAVVEDVRAPLLQRQHRPTCSRIDALARCMYSSGSSLRSSAASLEARARAGRSRSSGSCAEVWSVTRSGTMPRRTQLGEDVGGVAEQADGERLACSRRAASPGAAPRPGRCGPLVQVAGLEALLDARAGRPPRPGNAARSSSPPAAARRPCRPARR